MPKDSMKASLRLMRSSRSISYWDLGAAGTTCFLTCMGFLAGALAEEDFLVGAMVEGLR